MKDERIWARADRTKAPPQRALAQRMRRTPMEAERKLWWHLRHYFPMTGSHFRRQVQIGPFIVDFASHKYKLVMEIDGGQHGLQLNKDQTRTRRLESEGYRILRFWNNEVLSNIEGVLTIIRNAITSTPTPNPSPQGGGDYAVVRGEKTP